MSAEGKRLPEGGFFFSIWGISVLGIAGRRHQTKRAFKKALGMGKGMAKSLILIILLIGLILAYIPPESIASFVGSHNIFVSTIGSALFGTITLIPAFIACFLDMANTSFPVLPTLK